MAELNQFDGQSNGGMGETTAGATAKRQRRPSVRLGDIGGDPPLGYENLHHQPRRGSSKQQQLQYQWKQQKGARGKSSETLAVDKNGIIDNDDEKNGGFGNEGDDNDGDMDLDRIAIGSWKSLRDGPKSKRGRGGSVRKRVRSNWVSSKIDESEKLLTSGGEGEGEGEGGGEEGFNLDNDEEMNRNFRPENSDDEEDEEEDRHQSQLRSFDNDEDVNVDRERGVFNKNGRRMARVSDEMEGPSDSVERNGVKIWLNQLGLGRYAPVFEIHEVDDEVLPMLTLEDLKDMGINAVGTRRKMFCSIQKLNRGFS